MMGISSNRTLFKFVALAAIFSLSSLTTVHASIISTDVSITAETDFDQGFGAGVSSGDFSLIEGGTNATSTYSGSSVVGSDPLTGSLLNTGDGIGFSGTATANDDFFSVGFDSAINIENTSSLVTYDIILKLVFSNLVNASGGDAYADSEFFMEANGTEVFFSDLLSDSFFGNEIAGALVDPVAFGGLLSESDTLFFNYALNPLDSLYLELFWTAEGKDSDGGEAAFNFSQFLSVESVTRGAVQEVSAPGSLFLFAIALAGLVARNVKTKN